VTAGLAWGFTDLADGDLAARALKRQLDQPDLQLVVVFCSPEYRENGFATAIDGAFEGVPVIGCTTSGEVTPEGYCNNGVSAVSFAAPKFFASVGRVSRLHDIDLATCKVEAERCRTLLSEIVECKDEEGHDNHSPMGLVLVDAMARREEALISCLNGALGGIPLFGASAGDNLQFEETSILIEGGFLQDVAVFAVICTTLPFKVFQGQHFAASDIKMVVTEADPGRRIVKEINAEPAVEEYARLSGLDVDKLTPCDFAINPLVVRLSGTEYVRSIQKANSDGSLTFACAIEEGLVLTLAEGCDLVSGLEQLLAEVEDEIGKVEAVLCFDCVFRRLELQHRKQLHRMPPIFTHYQVTGFSSYGQQLASMHVNQTFTGLAIGKGGIDTDQTS